MVPPDPKPTKPAARDEFVTLELNPASGVDVYGDGNPPLLWAGMDRDFTPSEAEALLAQRNEHGTPIVRIAGGK